MFIDIREREMEREGNINVNVRNEHWLVTSCMHLDWRFSLQPSYVPWPGIKPTVFRCIGRLSSQLSHVARAVVIFLFDSLREKRSASLTK